MKNQTQSGSFFDSGLAVTVLKDPLGFAYGEGIFGSLPELRSLNTIRKSLLDPDCDGPDPVYAIAMDIGKIEHKNVLQKKMLLYGVVTYAAGKLGNEPVRSQGHIHAVSGHSGWSPPELYEIWSGRAIIYMQESASDDPGRCFAVSADPGEAVLVPPGWAHCTISADPFMPLTFGAWCDREYGFEYTGVRSHHGLAWYPVWKDEVIVWYKNPRYRESGLIEKNPESYVSLGIKKNIPIYVQFEHEPDALQFISKPGLMKEQWDKFIP
jgi:glucose-6-phosphate isomerase